MSLTNNAFLTTEPASAEGACACCGRVHRKLYLYKGRMVGATCRDNCSWVWKRGVASLAAYSVTAAHRAARFLGVPLDYAGLSLYSTH